MGVKYDLCITGDALTYLQDHQHSLLFKILPHITVFARFAPKQKEYVIVTLKYLGYTVLMCGDGTNDVGALKHADVGVAILANAPEHMPEKKDFRERLEKEKEKEKKLRENIASAGRNRSNHALRNAENSLNSVQSNLQKLMKEIEDQDQAQIVKLGDASIASPFTSKLSSIMCGRFETGYYFSPLNHIVF